MKEKTTNEIMLFLYGINKPGVDIPAAVAYFISAKVKVFVMENLSEFLHKFLEERVRGVGTRVHWAVSSIEFSTTVAGC